MVQIGREYTMLTRIAVAVSVLCLVLPAATFAQGFTQGDKEVLLNGSGVSAQDFDSTIFAINGSLGYFFTNHIEGAIRQGVAFTSVEDQGSSWNGSTRGAADYHFDFGRLWPFVGGSFGATYGDDVSDTWQIGIEGGAKYFVNSTTFIMGMIGFDWFFEDDENDQFDEGQWVYTVGIGFKF
jgi:hypothetical protein